MHKMSKTDIDQCEQFAQGIGYGRTGSEDGILGDDEALAEVAPFEYAGGAARDRWVTCSDRNCI